MNTYAKYCPNVFVAKCTEEHAKGETIMVTTKYGRENECIVWNKVAERDGYYYYSITRADGYNCQERAKAKAEKLQASAERAEAQAHASYERACEATRGIEFGQPILVDHYSAKYHRAALKRSDAAMSKSVEMSRKSDEYENRAKYWEQRANVVNLSMPESIEYYAYKVEQLIRTHQYLKDHPEARPHSFALTYAKKDLNQAQKDYETAVKLWGEK